MDERSMSTPPAETPIASRGPDGAGPAAAGAASLPIDDPRALAILTTEHWSLLSARSLVYNESFARAGMFLAFLSTTMFALGLIATATGFSDGFLVVAAVILSVDLFVGLASLGRMGATSQEDMRYLQAMGRLRHAYLQMVPGLEPYFMSAHHDDAASVLAVYGPINPSPIANLLHGFTTTPGMIGMLCSVVTGALAAVLLMLATHNPAIAGLGGLAGLVLSFVVMTIIAIARVTRFMASLTAAFPKPGGNDSQDG
jgi:hypothetical protein